MKVVWAKAGHPELLSMDVKNSTETLKMLVNDGYFEVLPITPEIDLWLNEEGKLLELPPNFIIRDDKIVLDTIVGDCFFASHDSEGNTVSLTEKMVDEIIERFRSRNVFKIN